MSMNSAERERAHLTGRSVDARSPFVRLAELIGDVADLLKRVESLTTTMDRTREEMREACWMLDSRLEPFRHYLAAEVEQTKNIAVKTIGVSSR